MKYEGDTNYNLCTWNCLQRVGKWIGKVENRWTSRDHPNYSIVKIGYNTDKSHGDLRKFAVTQIPVKKNSANGMKNVHNNNNNNNLQ